MILDPVSLPVGTYVSFGYVKRLVFGGLCGEFGKSVRLYDVDGGEHEVDTEVFRIHGSVLKDQVGCTPHNSHVWDDVGERCVKCGDKDWMAGAECSGPLSFEPKPLTVNEKLDLIIKELQALRTIVDARGTQYGAFQQLAYDPNRCLACGETHVGLSGLPCPNMRATC